MWRLPMSAAMPAEIAERRSDPCTPQEWIDEDRAERDQERRDEIDRLEYHVLACIRGERKDVLRNGTTDVLNMAWEAASWITEDHAGIEELVRRCAAAHKDGDWQAVTDQIRDVFDAAVRRIAEAKLPTRLQEDANG